ncbi:MAG: hypothetical protein QOK05_186 [Chloroflexota bacterium]|jgi:predicted outer membrane repeat protein|nr:hypothetical protein [Chloroflexota bacterium]
MPRRTLRAVTAMLPFAGVVLMMSMVQTAMGAETIHPTVFTDVTPADCAPAHTDPCTLRAAVLRANGQGDTTIQLDAGTYNLTIARNGSDTGVSGDLEVSSTVTIQGAGAGLTTIHAGTIDDRVLEVEPDGTLILSDLKVSGGRPPAVGEGESDGGGVLNDGATLVVSRVIFDDNRTARDDNVSAVGNGGGLATVGSGHTSVRSSTFTNNYAEGDGGGIYHETSANSGTDTFSGLLLDNNRANGFTQQRDTGGGAIYNSICTGNTIRFTDITATNNNALRMSGGAIYEDSCQNDQTTVSYDRLTLSHNSAFAQGGGFYLFDGATTVTNSTITDNSIPTPAQDGIGIPEDGGGVAVGGPLAHLTLNNDTISFNTSPGGTAGGVFLGRNQDHLAYHNTIVHGNTARGGLTANCAYTQGATVVSNGYNLANDNSCGLTGTADRQGSQYNPNLGVLADNGGPRDGAPTADSPTLTRALPSGSIAINTADNANCPAIDERGVTRPQQTTCDVGAYEFVLAAVATPTPALPKAGAPAKAGDDLPTLLVVGLVIVAAGAPLAFLRRRRS